MGLFYVLGIAAVLDAVRFRAAFERMEDAQKMATNESFRFIEARGRRVSTGERDLLVAVLTDSCREDPWFWTELEDPGPNVGRFVALWDVSTVDAAFKTLQVIYDAQIRPFVLGCSCSTDGGAYYRPDYLYSLAFWRALDSAQKLLS